VSGQLPVAGVRTEEARALTWDHVDLDGNPAADPAGATPRGGMALSAGARRHQDRELRTSFVSLMSESGVPVEEIARPGRAFQLADHGSRVPAGNFGP
jgi:hypothetical protein